MSVIAGSKKSEIWEEGRGKCFSCQISLCLENSRTAIRGSVFLGQEKDVPHCLVPLAVVDSGQSNRRNEEWGLTLYKEVAEQVYPF